MTKELELKQCPRCGGDTHTNRDMYGTYKECLQCGHMLDMERPNLMSSALPSHTKRKVA